MSYICRRKRYEKKGVYEIRIQKAVDQEKHQCTDDGAGEESHQASADSWLWQKGHGDLTSQESLV